MARRTASWEHQLGRLCRGTGTVDYILAVGVVYQELWATRDVSAYEVGCMRVLIITPANRLTWEFWPRTD